MVNLKFSPLAWRSNGFYYSRYPNEKRLEKTLNQEVYYHKVGTPQADGEELLYYLSGFTLPRVLFSLNLHNYENKPVEKTEVSFDYENIVVKRTLYTARNSAKVPIFLVYMNGMKQNGNNPTLLEGYGGFGVLSIPHFDPGIVLF